MTKSYKLFFILILCGGLCSGLSLAGTAVEAMAGMGLLLSVPTKLAQEVAREDAISTLILRGESRPTGIGETWNQQRQAEAMMSHNIARDFNNEMDKAAAQIKTEFLIIIGQDDRVVTPQPAKKFTALIDRGA